MTMEARREELPSPLWVGGGGRGRAIHPAATGSATDDASPHPLPTRGGGVPVITRRIVLGGRVQGVGFRPFVYRLAHQCGVTGWVRNRAGQVEILAQTPAAMLDRFTQALLREAPPLARPVMVSATNAADEPCRGFHILDSDASGPVHVHVPPDQFTCDDCLSELSDPRDRRFGYPFINCTQCGPRYTLITRLPYDRPNTTMARFPLCPDCAAEYRDPLSRRFHAEPIACPICGPQLSFVPTGTGAIDPLAAAVAAIRAGQIVAVKGVGGYHLVCDARNAAAVNALRTRKRRPHKPLAIMVAGPDALAGLAKPTPEERDLLLDPMRPVVLLRKRAEYDLPDALAPGCNEIGVLLPYSPLHHLLLARHGGPLVATSANPSGEPVLTDNAEVETRLGQVADAFLHHDRPIARPADDPVFRVIAGTPRPIRIGRGNAPLEMALPVPLDRPTLAFGGQMKATIALGWGSRAVVSPHLGDMDTPCSLALLQAVADDLQRLFGITAERVACDAHPDYASTRLAARRGLPVTRVWHHHAHASALAAEHPPDADWIVFTWDGTGLGPDGTIWGGETLVGRPGQWRRAGSLRPFSLPGGERSARQPWRSALGVCWEDGRAAPDFPGDVQLLRQAWRRGVNCPRTSSAGRLFDAAAALLGLVGEASFEGQAPMWLEAVATDAAPIPLPLARDAAGVWRTDWAALLGPLLDGKRPLGERAGLFHASLAYAALEQARAIRAETGIHRIGLTGGVFQNRRLSETLLPLARQDGFIAVLPAQLPCNDAGLSFGQLVEVASTTALS